MLGLFLASAADQTIEQVTVAPWVLTMIVTLIGGVLSATGGWIAATVTARKNARDDRQALIDQIQEERTWTAHQLEAERVERRAERQAYEERITEFWTDKALSRQAVAELRAHIWEGKGPPPPDPPAGYKE